MPNTVNLSDGRERSRVPTRVGMALRAVRFFGFDVKLTVLGKMPVLLAPADASIG